MSATTERMHLVMHPSDNVTTLLDHAVELTRLKGALPIAPGVPFGHKAALKPVAAGEELRKYGVVIGHATQPIAQGEHVHVHNCR